MASNPYNPPQVAQPVFQEDTPHFSISWYQWFTNVVAKILNAPVSSAAPATSAGQGTPGQIAYDANFIYVCIASNVWKRAALNAF